MKPDSIFGYFKIARHNETYQISLGIGIREYQFIIWHLNLNLRTELEFDIHLFSNRSYMHFHIQYLESIVKFTVYTN